MENHIDILVYKDLSAKDWDEALRKLSKFLYERGYVKDTYEEALIKREHEFPTGLEIPDKVNVAIPHADVEHVNKQALLISIPDQPIKVGKMDDPDEKIDIHLILLLAIKNPDGYVKFLSDLTTLFQVDEFSEYVKRKDYEGLIKLIKEKTLKHS